MTATRCVDGVAKMLNKADVERLATAVAIQGRSKQSNLARFRCPFVFSPLVRFFPYYSLLG